MTCRHLAIAMSVLMAGLATVHATSNFTTVINSAVTSYDFSISGGVTSVAYESAGNVYFTQQAFNTATWSAPTLLGVGTGPSLSLSGGTAFVSYILAGTVNVASFSGGSWSSTDLLTGATNAKLRTDSAGTLHLLSSVNSGYGSINYTSNAGSGWAANTNIATGWYDSGSGNYYSQAILATSASATGCSYIFEADNWGGRASWSSKGIAASGLTSWPNPGTDWNTSETIGFNGLSLATDGHAMAGYQLGGTGYVQSFDGTTWTEMNLGAASDVMVLADAVGGDFVYYASGGILKQSLGGAAAQDVMIGGLTVAGYRPDFGYLDAEQSQLFYLDSTTNYLMSYAVPESGSIVLCLLAGAGIVALRFLRLRKS